MCVENSSQDMPAITFPHLEDIRPDFGRAFDSPPPVPADLVPCGDTSSSLASGIVDFYSVNH